LDSLRNFLNQGDNLPLTVLILAGLVLLLLIGLLISFVRFGQVNRRLAAVLRGGDGDSLESALNANLQTVAQASRRMDALEQTVAVLQAQMPQCIQHIGLTRYDAFEDVGGEQSFSLSLLDAAGNGVVLTGVYNRMDMRVYAKKIENGKASHALSDEESKSLRQAVAR
jgi:hypothetical protein